MTKTYDSSNIRNLQFPDDIRAKPGMYVSSTDASGVGVIVREPADNSVDEALAGRCSEVNIHIDGSDYYVWDDGKGIPRGVTEYVDPVTRAKSKVPTIKAVFTLKHTSGKFDDKAYATSRGTHGLGVKASNALSSYLEANSFFAGSWTRLVYERGLEQSYEEKAKKAPLNPRTGKPLTSGTYIHLVPDKKIFSTQSVNIRDLAEWSSIAAYFTPNFKVHLSFMRGTDIVEKTYHFPEGAKSYVHNKITALKCTPMSDTPIEVRNALVDCVFQFTDFDGTEMAGFTNGLRNIEGGTHLQAFYQGIAEALEPYRGKKQDFTIKELREGVVGLINAKLSEPKFSSQTKEKLTDDRAGAPVKEYLVKVLTEFFKKNKQLALDICERAQRLKSLHNEFLSSKKAKAAIKKASGKGFHPNAVIAQDAAPHERELILLEGESAAGGAKIARNWWQEILPLKGKPRNAAKSTDEQLMDNKEIIQILAHLGFNPDLADPYTKLRINKIIVLADPDDDGPLHGDTLIRVRKDKDSDWQDVPIKELSAAPWLNGFQVLSWNGREQIPAQAENVRITTYTNEVYHIEFDNGTKVQCAGNHVWCMNKAKYDARLTGQLNNGLKLIQTRQLKNGDVLPLRNEEKPTQMLEAKIVKIKARTLDHNESFYCMTVPAFHCFYTAAGILSKNCHIKALVLTLLHKFLPELFERGMVYTAETPEFYSFNPKTKVLIDRASPLEVKQELERRGEKGEIKHIKGWGEVDADLLRIMAFDPDTRKICKITTLESAEDEKTYAAIMGEGSEGRKILLGI